MIGVVTLAVGAAWIGAFAVWLAGMGLWAMLGAYVLTGAASLALFGVIHSLCSRREAGLRGAISNPCTAERHPRSAA